MVLVGMAATLTVALAVVTGLAPTGHLEVSTAGWVIMVGMAAMVVAAAAVSLGAAMGVMVVVVVVTGESPHLALPVAMVLMMSGLEGDMAEVVDLGHMAEEMEAAMAVMAGQAPVVVMMQVPVLAMEEDYTEEEQVTAAAAGTILTQDRSLLASSFLQKMHTGFLLTGKAHTLKGHCLEDQIRKTISSCGCISKVWSSTVFDGSLFFFFFFSVPEISTEYCPDIFFELVATIYSYYTGNYARQKGFCPWPWPK